MTSNGLERENEDTRNRNLRSKDMKGRNSVNIAIMNPRQKRIGGSYTSGTNEEAGNTA